MLAIIGRSSENFAGTSRNSKESRVKARNSAKKKPVFYFVILFESPAHKKEAGTPYEIHGFFSKEAAALGVPTG